MTEPVFTKDKYLPLWLGLALVLAAGATWLWVVNWLGLYAGLEGVYRPSRTGGGMQSPLIGVLTSTPTVILTWSLLGSVVAPLLPEHPRKGSIIFATAALAASALPLFCALLLAPADTAAKIAVVAVPVAALALFLLITRARRPRH